MRGGREQRTCSESSSAGAGVLGVLRLRVDIGSGAADGRAFVAARRALRHTGAYHRVPVLELLQLAPIKASARATTDVRAGEPSGGKTRGAPL
eukprot:scaffold351_cov248-Pinguiococcus_pyrenoidosus.AAC.15